ncbi:MAG: non-homologous end-joining DNA ligase [Longimicrobiales bacterium]
MTPEWLQPMAATLTQERFIDPAWVFEQKLDGIRLLAFRDGDDVRLLTRNRLPRRLPHVAHAIASLPVDKIILDGESTWDGNGDVAYHVFDVLWLDGRDVTALPLVERYALLDRFRFDPPLGRVARLEGAKPWEHACSEGWEGVIAKRLDSTYEHRRSRSWLKMKCEATQQLVVGGFTDPQRSRVGLGALLVGYYDEDGDFVFAGKVGTGFDTALLLALRARLDALEIATPPFTKAVGLPRVRAHWVRPEIVVDIAFIEWTVHGKLRHSRLLAIRDDRSPHDVVRRS